MRMKMMMRKELNRMMMTMAVTTISDVPEKINASMMEYSFLNLHSLYCALTLISYSKI